MKIIQSFWSAKQSPFENNFGWCTPGHHWLSWILSALQLNKFYDVELYTDKIGYDVLIQKLKLPYKKVHVILDKLDSYPKGFWALPKIMTYSLQNDPFLHVDGDVFIWEPFSENLLNKNLVAQNLEITTEYYNQNWQILESKLKFIPNEMNDYVTGKTKFACNMGVFGGNDISFIKKYSNKSLEFVEMNKSGFSESEPTNFNVFFEQVLFYLMANNFNKDISYIFDEISYDNGYEGMGEFDKVPFKKKYLHLLGDFKRNLKVCKKLEIYVLNHYPEYFKRLINLNDSFFPYFKNELPFYDFTLIQNNLLINQFPKSRFINSKYLFSRDLLSMRQPSIFYKNIEKKIDFDLEIINGWSTNIDNKITENESFKKLIEIHELGDYNTHIPIDEIDEMIFSNIRKEKKYSKLMHTMIALLDENAYEIRNQFSQMIEDRIYYFISNKMIRII